MNLIKLALTIMLLALLSNCAPPDGKKEAEKSAPTATDIAPIDKVRNDFMAAFNTANPTAIARLYTDDAVLMPSHQPVISGSAAIEDYNRKFFETYSARITITPVETKIFGERALDRGTYTIELTPKAGGAPVKDEGKYLIVLQRQADGSFKVTHDIDNTNIPAPPPAAPAATKK